MVGIKIKNIRVKKKITQKELSLKTNINQSIISRYENESIIPPIPKLKIIAKALGVEVTDLIKTA